MGTDFLIPQLTTMEEAGKIPGDRGEGKDFVETPGEVRYHMQTTRRSCGHPPDTLLPYRLRCPDANSWVAVRRNRNDLAVVRADCNGRDPAKVLTQGNQRFS